MALFNYHLAAATGKSSIHPEDSYKEHFESLLEDVCALANEGDSDCQNALQFCLELKIITYNKG
jgi:hypothetical protein